MGAKLLVQVDIPARTVTVELDPADWVVTYGVQGAAVAADVREYVLHALNPANLSSMGAFGSGEVKAKITVT